MYEEVRHDSVQIITQTLEWNKNNVNYDDLCDYKS